MLSEAAVRIEMAQDGRISMRDDPRFVASESPPAGRPSHRLGQIMCDALVDVGLQVVFEALCRFLVAMLTSIFSGW
jgi:hypothetical protein